ncbi:unnamed protein product [Paramecium sonneborni]|uniref:SPRY domain-containing protein n=1 Tax=Paramecium sonneborni TaxID=65129 RepID=A0A8S1PRI3_9CILI|nr:unnamed protein product [Paramecium sonneborni]
MSIQTKPQICQIHQLEILAIDLQSSNNVEDKYYCLKCLTQKFDQQQLASVQEAKEKISQIREQEKQKLKDDYQKRIENLETLRSLIREYTNSISKTIKEISAKTDAKIEQLQKQSQCDTYLNDEESQDQDVITQSITSKEQSQSQSNQKIEKQSLDDDDAFFCQTIQLLADTQNSSQYQAILKQFEKSQICKIDEITQSQNANNDKYKTPSLKVQCQKHMKEIIMINTNPNNDSPLLACVVCISEFRSTYLGIGDFNKKYVEFQKEFIKNQYQEKNKLKFQELTKILIQWKKNLTKLIDEFLSSINDKTEIIIDQIQQKTNIKEIFDLDEQEIKDIVNQVFIQKNYNNLLSEKQKQQSDDNQQLYEQLSSFCERFKLQEQQNLQEITKVIKENFSQEEVQSWYKSQQKVFFDEQVEENKTPIDEKQNVKEKEIRSYFQEFYSAGFVSNFCGTDIEIINKHSVKNIKLDANGHKQYAVMNYGLSKEFISTFRFKIQNHPKDLIFIGVCNLDVVKSNSFKFNDQNQIGHGGYLVCSNGYYLVNSDKQNNNKSSSCTFQTNDIIQCTYNPKIQKIKFTNQKTNEFIQFDVPSNVVLYPCVAFYSVDGQIEFIPY